MLAQTNPLAHSEVIAVGTLHGAAPGILGSYEIREGGNGRLGTALYPFVGTIDNHADAGDLVVTFARSATHPAGYATTQARVNGALVNTITVKPKARVQFSIDTLLVTSKFLQVSYAGLGFGRIGLHSFLGRLVRIDKEV